MLLFYLAAAARKDLRTREVSLKAAAAAGAAAVVVCLPESSQSAASLAAGMLPGVCLLAAAWATREKIGYGDGWVLLVCGLYMGAARALAVLMTALLLACPAALYRLVFQKADKNTTMAFVPFLLAGNLLYLLLAL